MPLSPITPAPRATPANNLATTVAVARTAGAGTLTVASGAGFAAISPPLSSSAFVRLTCYRGNDPNLVSGYARVHLKVTGASGNVLTVAAMDGTTDLDLHVGDLCWAAWTADSAADVHAALGTVEAATNATIAVVNANTAAAVPAGGTSGQVLAKSSGADFATHWIDAVGGGPVSSITLGADVRLARTNSSTLTIDDGAGGPTYVSVGNYGALTAGTFNDGFDRFQMSGAALVIRLSGVMPIIWRSAAGIHDAGSVNDVGLARDSAGALRVTDGGSGVGRLRASAVSVEANAAPADASLSAGQAVLWFDSTNGTSRLVVKGKSANGTVVTGSIPLA